MKRWTSFAMMQEDLSKNAVSGIVMTIGNFDGFHLGHQKLIKRVKQLSNEHGWLAVVVTFQEHTSLVLGTQPPLLLMSVEERCQSFANQGMDGALLLEFTPEVAKITAESFLEKLVSLGVKALVVGHDFTFGAGGAGDTTLVVQYMQEKGLYGEVIPPVKYRGKIVCSSQVRELLLRGRLAEANRMLNRPFRLAGTVVSGQGQGRKLGFPTANLSFPPNRLLPKFGVYFVRVMLQAEEYYGLANVGSKPTFGASTPVVEVFIYQFSRQIYGEQLTVEFLEFLREEQKFPSVEALIAQMRQDEQEGKEIRKRYCSCFQGSRSRWLPLAHMK